MGSPAADGARSPARSTQSTRQARAARNALLLLCVLAPLVYLPRVLFGCETPLPATPPPAWTHLVVVTVGGWSDLGASLADPTLAAFDRRASRIARAVAPSDSRAATAASFWTGRHPSGHGVVSNALALGPGRWTLARGARSVGTRTAAFLGEPFVSATAIGGFDRVVETPGAGGADLGAAAAAFLHQAAGERVLLWLHLATPGPAGRDVAAALERLQAALDATDRAPETALVLAVLDRRPASGAALAPNEALARLESPLWVALPGALSVGRRSDARVSLVDVSATLVRLLGLAPPASATLDGRADLAWNALRGGGGDPGVLVSGGGVDAWLRGDERVLLDRASGTARAERRADGGWVGVEGQAGLDLQAAARQATDALQGLGDRALAAVPARVPAGWGDWTAAR